MRCSVLLNIVRKNAKKQNTILASSDMNLVYQIMTVD